MVQGFSVARLKEEGIGLLRTNRLNRGWFCIPNYEKGAGNMVHLSREDVVKSLKVLKSYAKQDVLRSSVLTENSEFWRRQAQSRKDLYEELIAMVNEQGVDASIQAALEMYANLPVLKGAPEGEHPEIRGKEQAFEAFFNTVGIDKKTLREARSRRSGAGEVMPDAEGDGEARPGSEGSREYAL